MLKRLKMLQNLLSRCEFCSNFSKTELCWWKDYPSYAEYDDGYPLTQIEFSQDINMDNGDEFDAADVNDEIDDEEL